MDTNKLTVIFDMDGTLYEFKGGSFRSSGIYDVIIRNTEQYISQKLGQSATQAAETLQTIRTKYGNSMSIGLEKEFGFNRHDYFNYAWNIPAEDFVVGSPDIKELITKLQQDHNLVLLSDAPQIWIHKVLAQLGLVDSFADRIFDGEGDVRKEFGNAFTVIAQKLEVNPSNCVVVGDEEKNDVIPAKAAGMHTVLISQTPSEVAEHTIASITELPQVLANITR